MGFKINLSKKVKKKNLKKFFNARVILTGLLLLFVLMFFKDLLKGVLLTVIFVPMAVLTTRWGKLIPHMTPETITASSIFMGFLFGGKIGFLFGIIVGLYAYTKNSCINLNFFTLVLMAGLCGILADVLKSRGMDFLWAFGITIMVRNLVGLPLYMFILFPNPPENILQHAFHAFFNIAIVMPVFYLLYNVVTFF